MKVYFIRHTQPQVEAGVCYGQTDLPACSLHFEKQYQTLLQVLPLVFAQVFSSPLQRCQVLAKKFTETPILDANLMELNFGEWEMQAWNNIPQKQLQTWMSDFVRNAPPKGESYQNLAERVQVFLQKLPHSEGNTLVCTHAGVMRAVFAWVLGLPLENAFRLKLSYASCLLIDLDKEMRASYSSVVALNNFEDFF
ncbi:MAG: alpha-ribazole phosphatase family protein [Raineya sp.]